MPYIPLDDWIEHRQHVWRLAKIYYVGGLFDFGVALFFLIIATPRNNWLIVWAINIIFMACQGAYNITKAEDIRKEIIKVDESATENLPDELT